MKQIIILATFLLSHILCVAQTNTQTPTSKTQVRKFDEFVFDDDIYKEPMSRFAEALSKEPSAKAYIIVYSPRVLRHGDFHAGYSLYYTEHSLAYENDYKISPKRIVTLRGGLRENLDVELFIVPKGAIPPKPTPTFKPSERIDCPRLGHVFSPTFVFENTNSPLTFSTSVSSETPKIKPIYK